MEPTINRSTLDPDPPHTPPAPVIRSIGMRNARPIPTTHGPAGGGAHRRDRCERSERSFVLSFGRHRHRGVGASTLRRRAARPSRLADSMRFFLCIFLVARSIRLTFPPLPIHPIRTQGSTRRASQHRGLWRRRASGGSDCRGRPIALPLSSPGRFAAVDPWRRALPRAKGSLVWRAVQTPPAHSGSARPARRC